jgi:uncharacterized protein YbjT (DUF2867 family)
LARRALVTGATGFIGSRLASTLARDGWKVRCLVRDSSRARALGDRGLELREGDMLDAESLRGVGEGIAIAYYLVHAMGRGGEGDFEERERRGARNFAEMATREEIGRVVYLGGLGDRPRSKHLRSRQRTAEILAELGPPLTYFRAGMVVGASSESYRTLRYLVQRLPAMIAPAWLATPTQPIGIDDVIAYLAQAPDVAASEGREVQIGGPDVLSYGDMLDRMAEALGVRRRPKLPVPLLTPWLSSLWIGLITPVDAAIARPLIEGLSTPTTVTDPSGATLFEISPMPFMEALQRAIADDPDDGAQPGHAQLRLLPDELDKVQRTGAVESVQAGELLLPEPLSRTLNREFLSRAAREYWRFIARISIGLIRVTYAGDHQSIVFLARPLVLLRFRSPDYELLASRGSVTWPIERGLLVSRDGRNQGFLRLSVVRVDEPAADEHVRVRVQMEVRNFYPWLRGSGRFARVGVWLYGRTQQRIHRSVTRGFLRSLAFEDLRRLLRDSSHKAPSSSLYDQ